MKQSENGKAQMPAQSGHQQGPPVATPPQGASSAHSARLRPDLVLLPLDEDAIAFSEDIQCLAGLNAAAAHLIRRMQDGVPVSALAEDLVSNGWAAPEEAEGWVTTVLDALGAQGFLANRDPKLPYGPPHEEYDARMARVMPTFTPMAVVAEQSYKLLDTCALVRFTHLGQVRLVDCIIGHLKAEAHIAPTVTFHLNSRTQNEGHIHTNIYSDGIPVGYAKRLGALGPLVKGALWSAAINAHSFLFNIHAGTVGTDKACILMPAAPGSGKSSLTAALTHRGFRYFSDEVALIEPDTFMVHPMPLAFCAKSTGWDLLARYYPEILSVPTHIRSDRKVVRYVAPPADRIQKVPATITHIIFPQYEKGCTTELQPIARSEALGRMMSECMNKKQLLDRSNVERLVRWISGIDCYALPFSSLEEAMDIIERTVSR